jgi:mannose-1-phosphate guanylyltransferase
VRAILLAAGLGTRLSPITDTLPKCLVPINGKPLLDYWIEQLFNAGIERILINTHCFQEQVEHHIENSEYVDRIALIYEKELLLTGGTVLYNKEFFNDQTFMLVHADNLSICDFNAFMDAHYARPSGTEITMMTFMTDTPQSCGIVEVDANGVVFDFHEKKEKPPSSMANAAVYIIEPSVVRYMMSIGKNKIDFSLDVIPKFLGKINTYHNSNYHRDIGTLVSYGLAQIECLKILNIS